jgi:hypothetical protein
VGRISGRLERVYCEVLGIMPNVKAKISNNIKSSNEKD